MKLDKVLCVTKTIKDYVFRMDEEEMLELVYRGEDYLFRDTYIADRKLIIPLYDHPHSDKENGQPFIHWHQNNKYNGDFKHLNLFECFKGGGISRPKESEGEKFEYHFLYKISEFEYQKTSVELIAKSKLKHKCIHKGKCPHRGFDLSNELADKDGIITCPLHGLKFDNKTKKLIN